MSEFTPSLVRHLANNLTRAAFHWYGPRPRTGDEVPTSRLALEHGVIFCSGRVDCASRPHGYSKARSSIVVDEEVFFPAVREATSVFISNNIFEPLCLLGGSNVGVGLRVALGTQSEQADRTYSN